MEEPDIKVTDRRRFSSDGELLDVSDEPEAAPPQPSAGQPPLPPPSFELLVDGLMLQAVMCLGLPAVRGEPPAPPDLEAARHTIDLLGILQAKTRGNLTLEEQRLLDNTLTELRCRYVQAAEEQAKKT